MLVTVLVTVVSLTLTPFAGGSALAEASPEVDGDTTAHAPEFIVTPLVPGESGTAVEDVGVPPSFPASANANAGPGELVAVYSGRVPEAAKPAVQSALERWATALRITVPVEVTIDWLPTGSEFLVGAARPTLAVANFTGAPQDDTFYPVALANQLTGVDLVPTESDIDIILADRGDWDYATTGPVDPDRVSLATVVLHEVVHGLGFNTAFEVDASGIGRSIAPNGASTIFDRFVIDSNGTPISSLPNASPALGQALTQGLFWQGERGIAANGGSPPVLFGPSPFQPESSIAHLDEATYPTGHPDSISTPLLVGNEAVYSVGTIAPAMLADMGWALEGHPAVPQVPVTVPVTPPVADPVSAPVPTPDGSQPLVPVDTPVPAPQPVGEPAEVAVVPPSSAPSTGTLPETGFPTAVAGILGALAIAAGWALVERSRWSPPVSRVTPSPADATAGGLRRYRLPA
jgi:hypothetical protein